MGKRLKNIGGGTYGTFRGNTAKRVGTISSDNSYKKVFRKNWKVAIKELMEDFYFTDLQKKSILEKAEAAFLPSDDNADKYNKAWNYFKLELKNC